MWNWNWNCNSIPNQNFLWYQTLDLELNAPIQFRKPQFHDIEQSLLVFLMILINDHSIVEYDRIIKNIERGEARISRKTEIMKAIRKKLDRYKNPWQELKIHYGQNKGKLYNEECDRFMVRLLCKQFTTFLVVS